MNVCTYINDLKLIDEKWLLGLHATDLINWEALSQKQVLKVHKIWEAKGTAISQFTQQRILIYRRISFHVVAISIPSVGDYHKIWWLLPVKTVFLASRFKFVLLMLVHHTIKLHLICILLSSLNYTAQSWTGRQKQKCTKIHSLFAAIS